MTERPPAPPAGPPLVFVNWERDLANLLTRLYAAEPRLAGAEQA